MSFQLKEDEDELYPLLHGKTFADLDPEDRSAMLQYDVNVQSIPESTPLETGERGAHGVLSFGVQQEEARPIAKGDHACPWRRVRGEGI